MVDTIDRITYTTSSDSSGVSKLPPTEPTNPLHPYGNNDEESVMVLLRIFHNDCSLIHSPVPKDGEDHPQTPIVPSTDSSPKAPSPHVFKSKSHNLSRGQSPCSLFTIFWFEGNAPNAEEEEQEDFALAG